MTYAIASIVPAAYRADGDLLMWALGYQPDPATGASTYSVPLSATGTEPATHYGCNAQAAEPAVAQMLQGAQQGVLPPIDWAAYSLTPERVLAVVQAMEAEIVHPNSAPWPVLIQRLGLRVVREATA